MKDFFIIAAFLTVVAVNYGADVTNPCMDRNDNFTVEIGCWGYKICIGGNVTTVVCPSGSVCDRDTKLCVAPGTSSTACGSIQVCDGQTDGWHPDFSQGCTSFFYCLARIFLGRQYCSPGLVYSTVGNNCDWPNQVSPPCGTMVIPP